ncbi:MAG: AAA family ATPase [Eubacteriales bacterium]|nr:AAA family ATPase [Eubacteriales bacterium]
MRIISCTIENFGKLNNVTYDFSEQCNTIREDNGWGKSTLASFIRVMFYGFNNENKKKLTEKERNRLMPWQKGVYGGEIVFETNGIVYSLRRTFGKKQADDEFMLVRKDTNMECGDFSPNIGEELFKIDSQSFERTVFIGQSDCVTSTTDSINAKIGNLADNTDDINNFETAVGKLTSEINNITSTRATGSIAKRRSRITELQAHINNYSEIDRTIEEQTRIRDELCKKREELKVHKEKMQEQQKVLSAKKDVQALKEKYKLLGRDCDNKKNIFEKYKEYFNDDIPDRQDVRNQLEIMDDAGRISGMLKDIDDTERKRFDELKVMFETGTPEDDVLDEWQNLVRRLDELKKETAKNNLSLEEQDKLNQYKKRFAAGIPTDDEIGRIHDMWAGAQARRNSLIGKEMKLDVAKENEAAKLERAKEYKNTALPGIIVGAVIAAAGVALAVLVLAAGIAMIIAGVCIVAVSAAVGASNKKKHDSEFTGMSEESHSRIAAIADDINADKYYIAQVQDKVKEFCDRYHIVYNENFAWELSRLSHEKDDYRELSDREAGQSNTELLDEIQRLDARISAFLKEYKGTYDITKYDLEIERIRNDVADYKRISEELSKQNEYRNEYMQKITGITHFLKLYIRAYNEEESIGEMLRELDKKLDEYYRAKSEYNAALSVKAEFEAEHDMSMFVDDGETADEKSLETITADMIQADGMLESYAEQIAQCNRQLETLQTQADECDNCRSELEELEQIQSEEKNKERLLKLTKEIMEDSKQSFTAKYMEPVMSGFRKYFTILTGYEPDAYSIGADTSLTVMEQNMPRDISYLSAGRQDLVGVCMRMALVEAMYKDEKPFLIFDDPFVNLDDNNIKGAMRLLDEIAKNYQVIYFTCSESRIHN